MLYLVSLYIHRLINELECSNRLLAISTGTLQLQFFVVDCNNQPKSINLWYRRIYSRGHCVLTDISIYVHCLSKKGQTLIFNLKNIPQDFVLLMGAVHMIWCRGTSWATSSPQHHPKILSEAHVWTMISQLSESWHYHLRISAFHQGIIWLVSILVSWRHSMNT